MYSHRNGETDEPTIEGWYWFKGQKKFADAMPSYLDRPVFVELEEGSTAYFYGADDDANDACADGWLDGKWYGPIVPPWEAQPAMPSPDWSAAPEWAMWWHYQFEGAFFSEEKPRFGRMMWTMNGRWAFEREEPPPLGIDIRQTLQRRPDTEPTP